MIIHTDSFRYLWEVLERGEYSFLFKDLVVIDAGCNVGSFSLWMQPQAKVIHAVDCEEAHIGNLKRTIADNGYTNIETYTQKLTDLADFMARYRIGTVDVLKLDIEGDEVELLAKENFPADKVITIVGEYHERPVKERLEWLGYRYTEYPNNHFLARK